MPQFEAVFFDNDGILVDTEHLYFQATREALARVGATLTREQYVQCLLVEARGAWHLATAQGVSEAEVRTLRDWRNRRYSELIAQPTILPGAAQVLKQLRGRVCIGVVTSSLREHFHLIHRATGFGSYFDFVVDNSDVTHSKPHPEPYLTALARSGVAPERCLVVEDSERGLRAATAAGLRCAVIPTAITRGSDFSEAWRVLDGIDQLPGLVLDEDAAK